MKITLLLFMIYSFIKFKVLVRLPESFHGLLGMRMYCNWPTDHAIDHSSIGLKRLTIQPVFNEVSLFTFSKGTHGFDVTVPKNYLKSSCQKKCQMSNSQIPGLWRRFTKEIELMRFTHIYINFDVTYEGHQNWSKIHSMDILRVF